MNYTIIFTFKEDPMYAKKLHQISVDVEASGRQEAANKAIEKLDELEKRDPLSIHRIPEDAQQPRRIDHIILKI